MNDQNNSLAFSKLKPLLVKFLRNCSIENIIEIENAVNDLDSYSLEVLQEFTLLPFIMHLKTKLKESITIKCIEFFTLIFKKVQMKFWKFFDDIFIILVSKISYTKEINKGFSPSEECKLSICECILNLINSSAEEILNEMYSFTFRPHLAYAFFVFNAMLKEEKSDKLLKAILRTMGALTYNESFLKRKYDMTELIASEALASCLPGLSVALLKIITGDDKQAHGVIIIALDILGKLIILTTEDKSFERRIAYDSSSEIHQIAYKAGKLMEISEFNIINSIPLVLKNEVWFDAVAKNLKVLIDHLSVVSGHNQFKVRYYVLKFSESLLCNCSKTLNNCISTLLSLICGLSVDSCETISSSAKKILVSLSEKFQSINYTSLSEIIQDNIENLVTQLIRCKFAANDTKKLTILKNLLGYIEISHLILNELVFSATFLRRIILTFLTLLEFNVTELNLIELSSVENFNAAPHFLWPKKKFRFFQDEEILNVICKICYSLGEIGNARVLIEYLLEKLLSSNLHTLQCIFVIGTVIKGLSNKSGTLEKYANIISDVLDIFLSPSLFDIPLSNKDNLNTRQPAFIEPILTPYILSKNKLQICLLLEAIANFSECFKIDFKIHLMTVLCHVMEKAGNLNYIIAQCGQLCLHHIAKNCQYTSIQELIKDNADYITNVIMINFYGCLHKPEIAIILRVAMEHNDAEAVVLFRDLIFQILECLDYNQDKAHPLLHILLSVGICIKKWFPSKKDPLGEVNNSSQNSNVHKSLREDIKDYIKLKRVLEFETHAENDTEEITHNSDFECPPDESFQVNYEDNEYMNAKKSEIPLHINIICQIFRRCIHLLSSENRFVRMLTLEISEVCILALHDYELQLLPLVHLFWVPFLRKFNEDTLAPKAFNVLITLANECSDFIRRCTFKEVMPKIVLFLKQEYSKSHLKFFRQYQYSTNHSLQLLLLSELGNLYSKFYVKENEFNTVLTVCLSYLKREQPRVLQEAAAKSVNVLSLIDPDAVWFYYNVAYAKDSVLSPTHKSFVTVSFPYCDNTMTSLNIGL